LVELALICIALGEQQAALLGVAGLRVLARQIVQQAPGLIQVVGRQRLLHVGVHLGRRAGLLGTVGLPVLIAGQQPQPEGDARENPLPVLAPPVAQRLFLIAIG